MYTILENARIVIKLLKEHNIRNIVLSPGGSNIPIVQGVQQDPFFNCYSIVDERSAMYFAIGLYLSTGEPVATSCTTANATRNYIPGLTEAFYKHAPILAITMSKHPMYLSQEYMQCPIQTSLPVDAVKKSYSLPRINNEYDRQLCIRTANEAILELTHHSYGPVQLNIEELDSETWHFDKMMDELPSVRTIRRYKCKDINLCNELKSKKILLLVGEHRPFSNENISSIEAFCEKFDVCVYCNHISNYHGKYSIQANLLLAAMDQKVFDEMLSPDVIISIGGITGDYAVYGKLFSTNDSPIEHWRVSEDGDVVDTYNKLTRVYEGSIEDFFKQNIDYRDNEHGYWEKWNSLLGDISYNVDVPFSNIYAAQQLCKKIPENSFMNYAILNSLRSWLYFPISPTIKAFSNVASFGIDGCMSTFIGESVTTDELCFLIIGDLSFFYDMNAIGIRHINNNVRILLVNNNGGVEFKLGGLQENTDVGSFIAADGHFKNAEGWAKTQGFIYLSAHNKEEFEKNRECFIEKSDQPIIFELFTNEDDERRANYLLVDANRHETRNNELKGNLKKTVKGIIGNDNAAKLGGLLRSRNTKV